MSGYSGTPLGKKLSLKPGMRVRFIGMPDSVRAEIATWVTDLDESPGMPDAVHVFETARAALEDMVRAARDEIAQDGMIWVSWPKKASKVETDITEDVVREIALPLGLVDIKVCAVDAVWSGLKLVIRRDLRSS